jgi:hypothetical protein
LKLIDKLPSFYEECPLTNTIQEGVQSEVDNLYRKVDTTIDQLYISSATWALNEWEKFAGIKKTDGTIYQRRARVSAKLKAKGTTTLEVMTSLCKSYVDDAKVTELFSEYAVLLELIINSDGNIANQYDIMDMDEAIWEIKPAHLSHNFTFNNTRKIAIKSNYEDITFKYIPCNAIYAGEMQPNTYFKESELYVLQPSELIEMEVI